MKKTNTKKQNKTLEEALIAFRSALTHALVEEAKSKGCTLSHFEVIKYVAEEGNPSMKDIAKKLGITPPSVSSLIDTLVAKHLVIRKESPQDRRTIRIMLTPKGHVLLSSVYKKKDSVFNNMLSKLNVEDKSELARVLIKCITQK